MNVLNMKFKQVDLLTMIWLMGQHLPAVWLRASLCASLSSGLYIWSPAVSPTQGCDDMPGAQKPLGHLPLLLANVGVCCGC
jgi:hypothetical protein